MSASIKLIALVAMTLIVASGAGAVSNYKVLYPFKGGNDGNFPSGALVFDGAGNLFTEPPSMAAVQRHAPGPPLAVALSSR